MMAYQFALLRYVHDPAAGEAVNVGLVFFLPHEQRLLVRTTEHYSRLSQFFTAFDGPSYRQLMRDMEHRCLAAAHELDQGDVFTERPTGLAPLLAGILPPDEGCFQWSQVMSGITTEADARFHGLYDELIARHEPHGRRNRREEADVRRVIDEALRGSGLLLRVRRDVEVRSEDYAYQFHAGWMNGRQQVVEPISLDYTKPADVIEKANTWSGRLYNLSRKAEFRLTGVVARPGDPKLTDAFERAVRILGHAPSVRKIVPEERMEEVLGEIHADLTHEG